MNETLQQGLNQWIWTTTSWMHFLWVVLLVAACLYHHIERKRFSFLFLVGCLFSVLGSVVQQLPYSRIPDYAHMLDGQPTYEPQSHAYIGCLCMNLGFLLAGATLAYVAIRHFWQNKNASLTEHPSEPKSTASTSTPGAQPRPSGFVRKLGVFWSSCAMLFWPCFMIMVPFMPEGEVQFDHPMTWFMFITLPLFMLGFFPFWIYSIVNILKRQDLSQNRKITYVVLAAWANIAFVQYYLVFSLYRQWFFVKWEPNQSGDS